MTTQYKNFVKSLKENGFEMKTVKEKFIETKILEFMCKYGHITTLTADSFKNKRSKLIKLKKIKDLCTGCTNEEKIENIFENWKIKIKNKSGHILLTLGENGSITYKCVNCFSICHSNVRNMDSNTGFCSKCQNDKNKNDFDDIKDE